MKITRVTNGCGLKEVARFGVQFRPVKRDRCDIVPEADCRYRRPSSRQETALAIADHYHLVERGVPSPRDRRLCERPAVIRANASLTGR